MRTYTQWVILGLVAFTGFVIICFALSFSLQPLAGTRVYPILPTVPTSATTTRTTTVITTTRTTTQMSTTTAANTTTPAPFVPLNISCPDDVTIVLGSSLNPSVTGYATATRTSVESCGAPVTSYRDSGVLDGPFDRKRELEGAAELRWDETQQGERILGVRSGRPSRAPLSFGGDALKKRSPTFAQTNVEPQYGNYLNVGNLNVNRPDANGASSGTQVISAHTSVNGSLYVVTDPSFITIWLVFSAATSFGTGPCAQQSHWGQATVNFDYAAQRWLLTERANSANALCLYLSDNADALDPWQCYVFTLPTGIVPSYVQIGIWQLAYAVTLNTTDAPNLCVLDRIGLLGGDPTPALICGESISGPLPAFTALQSWTPLGVEGDAALPDSATASAGTNTIAVVYMRAVDDELQQGANTPSADYIQVEHWTNINFTLATWIPLRYVYTIADYDASFAACESETACIPLPDPVTGNVTQVDPVREVMMRRLVYRDQRAWGSFVSNANGVDTAHVRWLQLIWARPTPISSPQWMLAQEGNTTTADGVHRWLSSIAVDSDGTAVLAYNGGNATLPAQMMVTSRLENDPLNFMRFDTLVKAGATGQPVYGAPNNTEWGGFASVSTLPGTPRSFYFHGQTQSQTQQTYAFLLRIRGETVTRTWYAEDLCHTTTCQQIIVEE